MQNHTVKTFHKSGAGMCVQITRTDMTVPETAMEQANEEGYIVLDLLDAAELCNVLGDYIKTESCRRQSLLKKQIEQLRNMEGTIFHEVATLPGDLFDVRHTVVKMVAAYCPVE